MLRMLLLAVILVWPQLVNAQTEQESTEEERGFQWELIVGLSAVYNPTFLSDIELTDIDDFIDISLLVDVSYKDFYIRSNRRRASLYSGEIGYLLHEQSDWAIDLIVKNYVVGFDPQSIERHHSVPIPKYTTLNERLAGNGIGLRYSYFQDEAIFHLDIASLHPSIGQNSWVIDSFYSYLIPYRNWDVYLGAGATYFSASTVDYYVGVSEEETSDILPVYRAGDGIQLELEAFAMYPLSQNWSFNMGLTNTFLSKNISRSPIGIREHFSELKIGVRYVF
ncbi:MipA/OmpV family protein [Psychrobium sp. 1_MG-2023]|uniref:MipA/OmpV family protein n=1 Tax=Psychrobium sp. 1_MG-2023 TaxID=3062624 RepID=UPI000C335E2D|nr:MipA/OmpV family protein [Psychrobium sp. 1_MG-2023]MDP2562557.1 MipA/OmpV family protein [Psychrobium sp. 1_MG-2023]PKF54423.1 hypothetical protein CW748_15970 [Alteromonadales bacterium alter-6D02]